jgi:hypothetical protein
MVLMIIPTIKKSMALTLNRPLGRSVVSLFLPAPRMSVPLLLAIVFIWQRRISLPEAGIFIESVGRFNSSKIDIELIY